MCRSRSMTPAECRRHLTEAGSPSSAPNLRAWSRARPASSPARSVSKRLLTRAVSRTLSGTRPRLADVVALPEGRCLVNPSGGQSRPWGDTASDPSGLRGELPKARCLGQSLESIDRRRASGALRQPIRRRCRGRPCRRADRAPSRRSGAPRAASPGVPERAGAKPAHRYPPTPAVRYGETELPAVLSAPSPWNTGAPITPSVLPVRTHAKMPVAALLLGAAVLSIAPNPTVSECPSESGRRSGPTARVSGREVRAELGRLAGPDRAFRRPPGVLPTRRLVIHPARSLVVVLGHLGRRADSDPSD